MAGSRDNEYVPGTLTTTGLIIIATALSIPFLIMLFGVLSQTTPTTTQGFGNVADVCFSKVSECNVVVEGLIRSAKTKVLVAVYSFTSDDLANALVEAVRRGVEAKVVVEAEQAGVRGSEYERLRNAGVDVRLDGNQYLMHHKFMVVDSLFVVTGSYNWSRAAEDFNDENIAVLEGVNVARMFEQEFYRLWSTAG